MPTTSRRETRDKEQPHRQKGKEEENYYALDKIDGACESYERASKSAQGKTETHGRTHARTHDVPPQRHARRNRAHSEKEKKKKKKKKRKRKTWLKEKVKNWLSNLTRVKSTTLCTRDDFHLLLSVLGQQLPIVANSILPNVFIHSTRSDLQPGG
jgi:hypothetical protein